MKKQLVFVIDKSGSMYGLEKDTVGGFNSMIEKQKKEEGEIEVSLMFFSTECEFAFKNVDIKDVKPLKEEDYVTGGCTAMLDAIGKAFETFNEKEQDKLFIIITDGFENASKEYNYPLIKRLIKERKKNDEKFIFLGANIDAAKEGNKMGLAKEDTVEYCCDSDGVKTNYQALSSAVRMFRTNKNMDSSWKVEIELNKKARN